MKDVRPAFLMCVLLFIGLGSATGSASGAPLAKKTVSLKKAVTSSPAKASQKKLSRDVRFNGSQVDGKYLSAGESIAEVEGDKDMGALIGIRKNFHDRLGAEKIRLANSNGTAAASGKGN
jgi:hypothetical protein